MISFLVAMRSLRSFVVLVTPVLFIPAAYAQSCTFVYENAVPA